MDKLTFLSRIHLFRDLDMEELNKLAPITPMNRVPKGTLLTSPHMEEKRLFLVKSGAVRLYRLGEDGKELTVDLLGTGHIFGEIGSFAAGGGGLYAETAEESIICSTGKEQFERIITEQPQLALKWIEALSSRLKEVEELLEVMAYGSVRKRLLFLLHKLSVKFEAGPVAIKSVELEAGWIELPFHLTHWQLATMMGSIRETVTELMSGLVSEGLVMKTGARKPMRLHPERLAEALRRCR